MACLYTNNEVSINVCMHVVGQTFSSSAEQVDVKVGSIPHASRLFHICDNNNDIDREALIDVEIKAEIRNYQRMNDNIVSRRNELLRRASLGHRRSADGK